MPRALVNWGPCTPWLLEQNVKPLIPFTFYFSLCVSVEYNGKMLNGKNKNKNGRERCKKSSLGSVLQIAIRNPKPAQQVRRVSSIPRNAS